MATVRRIPILSPATSQQMTTPLRDLLDGVDVAMWELVLAADGHCPLSAHDQLVRDAVELAGLFRARVKRAFDGVVAS